MSPHLTFRDAVYGDLAKACHWYDERRPGLSDEYMDCFRAAVKDLVHQPASVGFVYRDLRRCAFKRFPYGVYYRLVGDEIIVVPVLHGRRSLRQLRNRE